MSDVSQGPDWWLATDGKWYPPERHPAYKPQQVASPQPPYQPPQLMTSEPPYPQQQVASSGRAFEEKSFIRSLYDFSFSSLVTLRVIRVLYVVVTALYSLAAVVAFVGLLARHTTTDILVAFVGVPIAYFIYLLFARIMFEILMVVFNIGKDVRAIRERG
jgi:Domain of unknown function (DUF4282)